MYLNHLCSVCAWREDCKKKYSMGMKAVFCPDFTRDVALDREHERETEAAQQQGESIQSASENTPEND